MKAHLCSEERARVPFLFLSSGYHVLSPSLSASTSHPLIRSLIKRVFTQRDTPTITREALLYKGGEMEYRCMRIISGSQEALIGWIDCWLLNCGYLLTLAFIGDSNWSLQCADAVQMCLFTRTLCRPYVWVCRCVCYIQGLLCKRSTCNEYLYFFI